MTRPDFAVDEAAADAIAELFNIGMGEPAAALSVMVGEPVVLSVPSVTVARRADIAADVVPAVGAAAPVCAVLGSFRGPFSGEAMLVFPAGAGLALVDRLVPGGADGPDGETARDALTEIGNIILNGCLASFANLVEGEVESGVPCYRAGPADQVIGTAADPVLFVRIDMALESGLSHGRALFLLEIASLDSFRDAVRRLVGGAAA
ncbi:chemotaxis protein [Azospirillum halopraeferens]|uniref:chemotaxis protein n=1 Tax=Azospirillum halopraeferens TaxID=34010 RepID=UPI00041103FB|nr:chemotaxis protein [Azospirillum halopraeferens]